MTTVKVVNDAVINFFETWELFKGTWKSYSNFEVSWKLWPTFVSRKVKLHERRKIIVTKINRR